MRFDGISFAFLAKVAQIRGPFFFGFFFRPLPSVFAMLQAFCGAQRNPTPQFLKNVFGNDFVLKISYAAAEDKAKVVKSAGEKDRHGDAARVLSRQTRRLMRVETFENK